MPGISTLYWRNNVEDVTDDNTTTSSLHGALWQCAVLPSEYAPWRGLTPTSCPPSSKGVHTTTASVKIRDYEGGKPIMAMDQNDGELWWLHRWRSRVFCHVNARGDVEPLRLHSLPNANIHEKSWLSACSSPSSREYRANWPRTTTCCARVAHAREPAGFRLQDGLRGRRSTEYTRRRIVDHPGAPARVGYAEKAPEGDRIWVEEHPTGRKSTRQHHLDMDNTTRRP